LTAGVVRGDIPESGQQRPLCYYYHATTNTNPPAQRGDYGQILQLGEAFSPAVDCNKLLMMMKLASKQPSSSLARWNY
ncbi:jg25557, partial [Pararge aegeria aegeria]